LTKSPSLIEEHLFYSLSKSDGFHIEGGSSITLPPLMYLISLSSSLRSTIPEISDPAPKFTSPNANPADKDKHSLPWILSDAVLDLPIYETRNSVIGL